MLQYDIIGCGEVLLQYHAPILNRLRRTGALRVRGCFDVSPERARRAAALLGATTHGTSPREADVAAADAVFVATPPDHHATAAEAYLARGKHALVEKPFVCTVAEASRLLAAGRASGGRVLVGHMRRLYPSVQIARAFVAAGGLGRIERVEATEGGRWDWPATSNYFTRSPFGGVLYDTGSHVLDALLFVLGCDEPGAARVEILDVRRDRTAEPAHDVRATILVHSVAHGDVPVEFAVSRTETLARAVTVYGSSGTLVVPGGFAGHPTLHVGRTAFRLDSFTGDVRPSDATGCFLLEHQTLCAAAAAPGERTVLDADRFTLLTELLEGLAQA